MAVKTIEKSTLDDVLNLSTHLRLEDINECKALGKNPYSSLLSGFIFSDECYTGKLDGKPIVMFGVCSYEMPKGFATIWLLASDDLIKVPLTFIRESRRFLNQWLKKYDILLNAVDKRNICHINWLKKMGMTFTTSVFINNYEFLQFYKLGGKNV